MGRVKGKRGWAIDAEKARLLCTALRVGNFVSTAVAYAGIPRSTLTDWLRTAKDAEGKEPAALRPKERAALALARNMEKALADSEVMDLARIAAAMPFDWTAAAFRLERRFPDRYGLQGRVASMEYPSDDRGAVIVIQRATTRPPAKWSR